MKEEIKESNKRVLGGNFSKMPRYKRAFNFLDECHESEYDWTSARPLDPPPSVMKFFENHDLVSNLLRNDAKFSDGDPALRATISEYFYKQGIECKNENIVIDNSVFSILDKVYDILGCKEILIPSPAFGYYVKQCSDHDIDVKFLETKKEDNWRIDTIELKKKLEENPEAVILLNYPNNPLGVVMEEDYARSIAEVLKDYPKALIISDEIFSDMVLDSNKKTFSIGSIAAIKDQVITLNGMSKAYGMAGARVSFASMRESIAEQYPYPDVGLAPLMQALVTEAIKDSAENKAYLEENVVKYHNNISLIKGQIGVMNEALRVRFGEEEDRVYVKPYIENPEAGNIFLLDFSGLKEKVMGDGSRLETGLDVARFILVNAKVAMVPGECFFIDEEKMALRLCTSATEAQLRKGFESINNAFVDNLKNPTKAQFNNGPLKPIEETGLSQ